jgi:hypothetical protein
MLGFLRLMTLSGARFRVGGDDMRNLLAGRGILPVFIITSGVNAVAEPILVVYQKSASMSFRSAIPTTIRSLIAAYAVKARHFGARS